MSMLMLCDLPQALLELTFVQSRQRTHFALPKARSRLAHPGVVFRRKAHALALKAKPDVRAGFLSPSSEKRTRPMDISKHVKRPPVHPIAILSERVEALAPETQEEIASAVELHFGDEELQMFYADILSHSGTKELSEVAVLKKTPEDVLQDAMEYITVEDPEIASSEGNMTSTLAARLASRVPRKTVGEISLGQMPSLDPERTHHSIIIRLNDVVRAMEDARKVTAAETFTQVPMLSGEEWAALVDLCVDEADFQVAEYVLELLKRSGQDIPEKLINCVADAYAGAGNVVAIEAFYRRFLATPSERQRDLHIKAHLKAASTQGDIHSALAVLHRYEAMALLPPVQSYTRLICSLFSAQSAQCHAQAWDLFAHMRYVAHPKPDELLYALMIRACAGTGYSQSKYMSQPERAMDLWTELREDMRHPPGVRTYDAIILACARTRSHANDAFRLAREMLDSHRDAFGNPFMQPSRETFIALLWAAKMSGDLQRARWILAEMLQLSEKDREVSGASALAPNERALVHVFHAYASYRPPFRRGSTKIVDAIDIRPIENDVEETAVEPIPLPTGRFGKAPPQTAAEVLAEAQALFNRILDDTGKGHPSASVEGAPSVGAFSQVAVTSVLVNSYLSVFYAHGTISEAKELFSKLFEEAGADRSPRSYVEVLERCAYEGAGSGRDIAFNFAKELWTSWTELDHRLKPKGATARLIERARAAMIRMCALIGDLDYAMVLLRDFAARYTCTAVATPEAKLTMRSARTELFGARPLVRMSAPSEVPDDMVPPMLTFNDLEILHQRLVAAGPERAMDISYVTFLGRAYEGALRTRRDRTIRT